MNIFQFDELESTNKYLCEHQDKYEDFSFVSTSYQTKGKGREERIWFSPKNENLLFSFLIKEQSLLKKYKSLSIGTATLIARFLELEGIKNVAVKWPNDVYVNGRKICGILLEGDVSKYLVIGVGLNVNQSEFKAEYRVFPTSMKVELQKKSDLNKLQEKLFKFIEKHIKQKGFESHTLDFYRQHDFLLNKEVEIDTFKGVVKGINDDFGIIIDNKVIYSGEVKF